ncbi:hypothetical protein DUI87_04421 [Hirundo rustica rustica]|uniref:Uncharacterized protein n=1 Tax=Hirundo rustica rustica TaxID=333673 RepID=A0A3M0L678_HIRRU|nr:hypothetical protein DUI87_04421 [Hirundo rustica rustica]
MLIRRSARPLKLHCPWVHDEISWLRIIPGCVVCTKKRNAAFSYHPNPHTKSHFSLLFWKGQGDFLQPQEGIPKDKKEDLKLLSSCALSQLWSDNPKILEEDWDAQMLPFNERCKVLNLKRRIEAVTTWRERNQVIE